MPPRMTNPLLVVPDALERMVGVQKDINKMGVPLQTLVLVHLRVSQINKRSVVIPKNAEERERALEKDDRHLFVANWREATCFTDPERAAMALAESVTRLSESDDPVPDEVWDEAARHFNEEELAAIVMLIGLVNMWNRINVATRQDAVDWRVPPYAWKPMTSRRSPAGAGVGQ